MRRKLSCLVFVAVEAVDHHAVECFKVVLPHACERSSVQPRIIRYEANNAFSAAFDNPAFGHAEKPDIKIVQALPLGCSGALGRPVGSREIPLLRDSQTGKAVVGGIAEDDQNGRLSFDMVGGIPLQFHLRK